MGTALEGFFRRIQEGFDLATKEDDLVARVRRSGQRGVLKNGPVEDAIEADIRVTFRRQAKKSGVIKEFYFMRGVIREENERLEKIRRERRKY